MIIISIMGLGCQSDRNIDYKITASDAVVQANSVLWSKFVDENGIILDYIGDLPTPEDCFLGKPNILGWKTPISNGAMFTGLYLPAACERARQSKNICDILKVKHLVNGLLKLSSISDVPGFIARGVGTDGICHYPIGSDDQTHPWFYGLHMYLRSGIPSSNESKIIVNKMVEVANALETINWSFPYDGPFKGKTSIGGFKKGSLFRDAVRYLHILKIMYDVTDDQIWLDRYISAVHENPDGIQKTRAEICMAGYLPDSVAIKNISESLLWIYVGSQASLSELIKMETDESVREKYHTGLIINATNAYKVINTYKEFDNDDSSEFGYTHWRSVFTTWYPQLTVKDGQELSGRGEDKSRAGTRRKYESRYMMNPLSAAVIMGLTGDVKYRNIIESVICHYDYTNLYMSSFFLAECAYYTLPSLDQ